VHTSCPLVGLVDLITLAHVFIKCELLEGKKKSFVVHFEFFHIRYRPMIDLKELALVNEIIKYLGYKTSKYIKTNPCVHPN
jgi:hypothetical protein